MLSQIADPWGDCPDVVTLIPTVANRVFICFEGVIDDRANAGVFTDRRHSTAQRTLITHQIRELPAGAWTGFLNHAEIPIEEHASVSGLTQDCLPVLRI